MLAALGLGGCDRPAPPPPPPAPAAPALTSNDLVVFVRPGPATFYQGPSGQPAGFDADLARLFAARKKMPVKFVPNASATEILRAVGEGEAHIGAGTLYRPVSKERTTAINRAFPGHADSDPAQPHVLWSSGYVSVEPVLVYNVEGFRPTGWHDLAGERVAYVRNTGLDDQIAALRVAHPDVQWVASDAVSGEALLAQVSDGGIDYAIVASNLAAIARNIYLNFNVAFPVDGKRELAWVLPPEARGLRDEVNAFFAEIKRDGTLQRLADRYFGQPNQVPRMDSGVLQERIHSILPQFRQAFELAQQSTGLEWRLLAAVSYQESQWDPQAVSETGARGMMQLTEETARHLRVLDRLDPKLSILAGAHYLRALKDKLPARIQEPDRTWLALAAFNIGLGHLEDARILAQKQKLNPDSWSDVKKTLPLLALPDYYEDAKLGYARGGMPVAFVDRVRAYYDVLLAHEPGFRPRLQVLVQADRDPEPEPDAAPQEKPQPTPAQELPAVVLP